MSTDTGAPKRVIDWKKAEQDYQRMLSEVKRVGFDEKFIVAVQAVIRHYEDSPEIPE